MDINFKHISLKQLKEDLNSLENQRLGDYFDDGLSMATYRDEKGYSNIIEFFNHLKDEYNKCISKNNGQERDYHDTLLKTFSWFLPFLNPCHKIIVQSNICILTDDEQDCEFHEKYFRDSLNSANRLIKAIQEQVSEGMDNSKNGTKALCRALDAIGYLDIREHNYESAILCLRMCLNLLSTLRVETHELYNLYINNIVRLANCYEYTDRPWCAINCMLGLGKLINDEATKEAQHQQLGWKAIINNNAEKIRSKIISYYNLPESELRNEDDTIEIVMEICGLLFENSKENKNYGILKWGITSKSYFKTLKYYIHVLAHCISEYAAKIRTADYSHPYCSTLQIISRFLLDWLVVSCQEEALVTCQATVRAENDACPEALKLLLKRHTILEKKQQDKICTAQEQNELQEIEFFLFYFAEQELRYNYTDQNLEKIFLQYGNKFFESASSKAADGDYDSLFHFYVIKFKYLFKQKIDEFMHIPTNKKLSMKEVDHVFLEMCRCKELCSEHIFKGLIDECNRLEELFALFQQLQWLNSKTISTTRLNLFSQLWFLHDKRKTPLNIRVVVPQLYNEIIERNKILILAPIKNAPSCSSEYENVQSLLDLPMNSGVSSSAKGDDFIGSIFKINRDRSKTVQKVQYLLNSDNKYTKLKWAVFFPNENRFVYLYIRDDNDTSSQNGIKYCGVVPIYLDNEYEAIKSILKRIDDNISIELNLLVLNNGICTQRRCTDDAQCNTFFLKPDYECNLRNLINELLAFLQFDFHAARQVGDLDKENLLINYPKTGTLEILAFDEQPPVVGDGEDLCCICDQCFIELSQVNLIENDDKKYFASNPCKIYSPDVLTNLRENVFVAIDKMDLSTDDKNSIKVGKQLSSGTTQSDEFARLCFRLNNCISGYCDKLGEQQCETYKLLKEHQFF